MTSPMLSYSVYSTLVRVNNQVQILKVPDASYLGLIFFSSQSIDHFTCLAFA